MTENIKSSFRDKVKKAPWLDDITKMAALSKLDYLNAFISHQDWLKDSQIIESDYAKVNKIYSVVAYTVTDMTVFAK